MEYVALVTMLIGLQCIYFSMKVGMARGKYNISAPATSGHEMFDRANRVHMNTLEQLMTMLPAMWVCGYYMNGQFAAAMGVVFIIGRFMYASAYVKQPDKRAPGMMIGFLATVALLLGALWGVIAKLIG